MTQVSVMPNDPRMPLPATSDSGPDQPSPPRASSPAAQRALAEAAARRALRERDAVTGLKAGTQDADLAAKPDASGTDPGGDGKEVGGRGGLEPTRYGDWEINGLASDF